MKQITPIEKLRHAIYCCYKGDCNNCLFCKENNCFKKLLNIIDKIENQIKDNNKNGRL